MRATQSLVELTERAFAADGPLARALPGYEPREGQIQMARAVAEVFASGGTLLAEAGTGTGKTLAYLVPAILSQQRVIVSTGTRNLQSQIVGKDLPVLHEALGVPFTATCMKGRGNYLCRHRFDQRVAEGHPRALELSAWASETTTGDRAEIDDLTDETPFWADISASASTCLGSDCPQFDACFVTRMRQDAAASDIVVVNHALLCADAAVRQSSHGEVIPSARRLILDEAHQLEDVATQHFGVAVSSYRVEDLLRDGDRLIALGLVTDAAGRLGRALARAGDDARALFSRLELALRSRGSAGEERLRISADWFGDIAESGVALITALERLEATLLLSAGMVDANAPAPDANPDAAGLARRLLSLRKEVSFLLTASDSAYVFFAEMRGRGASLRAAPIDVAGIVRSQLLDRMHVTVATSATLSVDRSFEHIRGRLGIDRADEVSVSPEFDYTTQALLYLPRKMPLPKAPHYAEAVAAEVIGILRRSRGRAFVLFSSRAAMRTVHSLVMPFIPYPCLLQGTSPTAALLERFRTTPNAVLFGTAAFWHGVDVAGEQLSCVVIDKLPFASPADPVTAARVELVADNGGSPFEDYQVPGAILTLRQGLGRLLRHKRDRGVLAVLDPRLRTMGYGRRFLDSLPPARVTFDQREIERFFAPGGP